MPIKPSLVKNLLIKHEGLRKVAYTDTTGHITIGVGREISKRGITESEAMHLLANDIVYFNKELERLLPWYKRQNPARQMALISMAFNLGMTGLLGFKKMLKAMKERNYKLAANEALDSRWADQVGNRAVEISEMILTGCLKEE